MRQNCETLNNVLLAEFDYFSRVMVDDFENMMARFLRQQADFHRHVSVLMQLMTSSSSFCSSCFSLPLRWQKNGSRYIASIPKESPNTENHLDISQRPSPRARVPACLRRQLTVLAVVSHMPETLSLDTTVTGPNLIPLHPFPIPEDSLLNLNHHLAPIPDQPHLPITSTLTL